MYYKLLIKGQNCGEVRTSILCQINLYVCVCRGGCPNPKKKLWIWTIVAACCKYKICICKYNSMLDTSPSWFSNHFWKGNPHQKTFHYVCVSMLWLSVNGRGRDYLWWWVDKNRHRMHIFFFCLLITSGWKDQISHMHTNWLPAQIPEAEMCFQRVAQGVTLLVHKERGGWWPTRWV